jgi:limonene-1,2-epoxide hydrolase
MLKSTRRGYLVAAVGIAGLSGCQDVLDGGSDPGGNDDSDDTPGSESSDPQEVVETFYRALNQSKFEAANELLHSETLEQPVTQERYGQLAGNELTVESVEVVDGGEEWTVVRANLQFVPPETSEPITDSIEIELRTEDDEWRIYASGRRIQRGETGTQEPTRDGDGQSGSGTEATGDPATVVSGFYAALDAGDRDAANARVHSEAVGIDVTQQAADTMADATLSTENVTLVEERADSATVDVTVIVSPAGSDRERSNRVRIELRPENGQWRIYSAGQAS